VGQRHVKRRSPHRQLQILTTPFWNRRSKFPGRRQRALRLVPVSENARLSGKWLSPDSQFPTMHGFPESAPPDSQLLKIPFITRYPAGVARTESTRYAVPASVKLRSMRAPRIDRISIWLICVSFFFAEGLAGPRLYHALLLASCAPIAAGVAASGIVYVH
jgi:hypothetical protein